MSKSRISYFFWAMLLLSTSVASAWADSIGYAVASAGSTTRVGSWTEDGTINFYIPISKDASGTYGVNGAGTTVDLCTYPSGGYGACGGGTLDMFLRFDGVQPGPSILTLKFNDLDLAGFGANPPVNDPGYFLESVWIFQGGTSTEVNDTGDAAVVSANADDQILKLLVNATNPFSVKLTFGAYFVAPGTPNGSYQNTPETVRATIAAVPEATSISVLGFGLVLVGLIVRKGIQI